MKVDIYVALDDCLQDAKCTAEYLGDRSDDYKALTLTDAEEEVLSPYWDGAKTEVYKALKWVTTEKGDLNDIEAELMLTNNFKKDVVADITNAIRGYCAEYMLAEWLKINNSEQFEAHAATAAERMRTLNILINTRRTPVRSTSADVYPTIVVADE